jgi:hypothetical protein
MAKKGPRRKFFDHERRCVPAPIEHLEMTIKHVIQCILIDVSATFWERETKLLSSLEETFGFDRAQIINRNPAVEIWPARCDWASRDVSV